MPRPGQIRGLTLTDASGALLAPNPILKKARFVVPRGADVVLFTPVGGDVFGTTDVVGIRVASDNSVKWTRRYRLPENGFIGGAVDDGQGVTFVAGQDATVYVVRIDDAGAIRAQQAFEVPGAGQNSPTVPLTLAPLDDGGLLVGVGVGALRLAADLTVTWANNAGIGVQRLAVLPDGDFVFAGDIGSIGVARLSPAGEKRFIGSGGIKGNFFHAGIAPTEDGGFFVVSGVDASDELVSTVTGRFAKDGKSATIEGVEMRVLDDTDHEVPFQFGSGYHLQRSASGRVWASIEASSGGIGGGVYGPVVIGFDDGKPVDAVIAGLAFAAVGGEVIGLSRDGFGEKDLLVRVPRPQQGDCHTEPLHLQSKTLASATYTVNENAMVIPIDATPVDAVVAVDDLTVMLSEDLCEQ